MSAELTKTLLQTIFWRFCPLEKNHFELHNFYCSSSRLGFTTIKNKLYNQSLAILNQRHILSFIDWGFWFGTWIWIPFETIHIRCCHFVVSCTRTSPWTKGILLL